jgi:hypothetical protein
MMTLYCDGDAPDFYRCDERRARKQYHCCECSASIEAGELHYYISGKWEGQLSTFRQHLLCGQACMLIRDELGGECVPFGALGEAIDDLEEWEARQDKYRAPWRRLRRLMARIHKRERSERAVAHERGD